MTTKLLEKALKSAGGLEEFKRKRDQFNRNLAFINENTDKLLEDYGDCWVAVYDHKIVAHGKHYNNILSQIRGKGLPVEQTVTRFVSSREVIALYSKR
jgi:hypothetical protein